MLGQHVEFGVQTTAKLSRADKCGSVSSCRRSLAGAILRAGLDTGGSITEGRAVAFLEGGVGGLRLFFFLFIFNI